MTSVEWSLTLAKKILLKLTQTSTLPWRLFSDREFLLTLLLDPDARSTSSTAALSPLPPLAADRPPKAKPKSRTISEMFHNYYILGTVGLTHSRTAISYRFTLFTQWLGNARVMNAWPWPVAPDSESNPWQEVHCEQILCLFQILCYKSFHCKWYSILHIHIFLVFAIHVHTCNILQ